MKQTNSKLSTAKLLLILLALAISLLCLAGCYGMPEANGGLNILCKHENLKFFPYTPATCEYDGNYECYGCLDCGKLFYDVEATKPIASELLVIIFAMGGEHVFVDGSCERCGQCEHLNRENCICKDCSQPAHNLEWIERKLQNCVEDGHISHYFCLDCEKRFMDKRAYKETDPDIIINEAYGHAWGDDGICKICEIFDEDKVVCHHLHVRSDCLCLDCNEISHCVLEFVPGAPASCVSEGYIDHYKCPLCKRLFFDEDPANEITEKSDLIILKIEGGHSYSGGFCTKCGWNQNVPTPSATNIEDFLFEGHLVWCTHPKIRVCDEYIAPTCTCDGEVERYYCESCCKFYLDAECTNEVAPNYHVYIPALGHNFVNGECQGCGNIDMSTVEGWPDKYIGNEE